MAMRPLKPWMVTVQHDDGTIRIEVWTQTKQAAIEGDHEPREVPAPGDPLRGPRRWKLGRLMGAQNILYRECCPPGLCSECGQERRRLYRYGLLAGRFCNFECASWFHHIVRAQFDYIHPRRN